MWLWYVVLGRMFSEGFTDGSIPSHVQKLSISPEIYIISTPVVYSSVDKITVSDRYFSGFLGSGFDYQISRRFKFNVNYKANLSTNPEFPILSFFLVGSKINL